MKGYVNASRIFLGKGSLVFIKLSKKLVKLCLIQLSHLVDLCILDLMGFRFLVYILLYQRSWPSRRQDLSNVDNQKVRSRFGGGGAGGENWFSYSQSWVSLPHLIASSMLHLPVYKLPYVQLIKSVIHKELIFNKWSVIFYIKRISTQLSKPETWAASLAPSTLFPNIQSVNLPCALPQVPLKLFPSPHPGHHHLCL